MRDAVLVRASRGEPLRRIVFGANQKLVYLANPTLVEEVVAGSTSPVGFPLDDVFEFEAGAYRKLKRGWAKKGETDPSAWAGLKPYRLPGINS